MAEQTSFDAIIRRLRRPLLLTWAGLLAERLAQSFWPLWTLCIAVLALLMLGVQDSTSVDLVWALGAGAAIAAIWFLIRGVLRFRWPRRAEAIARLDASMKGRPLQTLKDAQAIGGNDAGSAALWAAHQKRMAETAAKAQAVEPDLRLSSRDPFGLRYIALTILMVGILFGSFWHVGSVRGMGPGGAQAAAGPSWEGWVAPPPYTRLPTLYLPDITDGTLNAPQGSQVTMRLYGPEGRLSVQENVSGRVGDIDRAAAAQSFNLETPGKLTVQGPGGREWLVAMTPDAVPSVEVTGEGHANVEGLLSIPFHASDDYGIDAGEAVITLDLDKVTRRYGLAINPEPRDPITLPLPMPIAGSRSDFAETLIENFSESPWANMPVKVVLHVTDMRGQEGVSEPFEMQLDARRFFDPLAAAYIEMRRDLLWNRANAPRVEDVLRAIVWQPGRLFRDPEMRDRTQVVIDQIGGADRPMTDEQVATVTKALWDMAVDLEDLDIDDAKERMRRAQERLEEAMRNGASDEEIAQLMQELRDATDDYMRQLSQQAAKDAEQNPDQPPFDMNNAMQMSQDDLQKMMDRIQELMKEGRMAEAQQALKELQQLLDNMRMAQGGKGGQGQQNPGQQALDGLGETLRNQQGLSDEAFRELQDQFNKGQQGQGQQAQPAPGQSQGGQSLGQNGQSQPGQPGGGQQQAGPGQGPGEPGQQSGDAESLARRQQELRNELNRQRGNLPGSGTAAGDAARDALGRAEGAMKGAEESLGQGDLPGAIDHQADAMDALREGMRQIGEAMAQQERQAAGQQGQPQGDQEGAQNDPLGRAQGSSDDPGSQQPMLQGEDVYREAQNLLDEIRRRSGETGRPQEERDYLNRLLRQY